MQLYRELQIIHIIQFSRQVNFFKENQHREQ